jgi:triacylglycerol lipase
MSQSFSFRDEWLRDPSGSFTWRSALALVSASRLAYSDQQAVQDIVEREWSAQAIPFTKGQSQGFVIENDRCMVIAFRGTDSVADWLGNMQLLPEFDASLGGALHGGFLEAYRRVADVVDAAFGRANGRPLWLTGHSLGGALAVIAAVTHRAQPIAGLMTFGQPLLLGRRPARTVDIVFAQRYRRFVNRDDLVARVPPGYVHAGVRVHFDSGGTVEVETAEAAQDDRPISSQEFVEIQATINAVRVETGIADNTESTSDSVDVPFDASVEGLIPGIAAHRIDAYVTEVNARASAEINA